MLEWGVIERSSSPYASPIICVKKSDGSVRLCLDARRINQLIVPTRDASPSVDVLLSRFHGKRFFLALISHLGTGKYLYIHRSVNMFHLYMMDELIHLLGYRSG